MINAVAAPVLLKAVDWIFGESSKILQERRERRKIASAEAGVSGSSSVTAEAQVREDLLHQPIQETLWRNAEAHIKHQLSLLDIYTANYHLAREQYAKFGAALVPPIVVHTLAEAEDKIVEIAQELRSVLSVIYGKKVTTSELELA